MSDNESEPEAEAGELSGSESDGSESHSDQEMGSDSGNDSDQDMNSGDEDLVPEALAVVGEEDQPQENPQPIDEEIPLVDHGVLSTGDGDVPVNCFEFDMPPDLPPLNMSLGAIPGWIGGMLRRAIGSCMDAASDSGIPRRPAAGGPGGGDASAAPPPPDAEDPDVVTLRSIGGLTEHIEWLEANILQPLRDPSFKELWDKDPPKGVLFYGPPGTGKTLLAKAFANELSAVLKKPVPFFHRKGGDLMSKWFGGSSMLIRELFATAVEQKPSIIFLDELDGLCPSRENQGTSQPNISIVTTLLGQIDVLVPGEVFVFAATNRLDSIDPAILRRFNKQLRFHPPTQEVRKEILKLYTKSWKKESIPEDALLELISSRAVGFTGADLENLCREVFFSGLKRHLGDELDGLAQEAKDRFATLQILEEDWTKAIENTRASNSSVYGSRVYQPQFPPDSAVISPLIQNIQEELLAEVKASLPSSPPTPTPSTSTTPSATSVEPEAPSTPASETDDSTSTTDIPSATSLNETPEVRTLFVWDKECDPNCALSKLLLPGVLTHQSLSEVEVLQLDQRSVLNVRSNEIPSVLSNTLRQAVQTKKSSCVLLIPRFPEVLKSIKGYETYFYQELMALQGKPVVVLATGGNPPEQLQDKMFRAFFAGKYKKSFQIRKPTKEERWGFFQSVLEEQDEDFKQDILNRTNQHGIDSLVLLRDNLKMTVANHKKEEEEDEEMVVDDDDNEPVVKKTLLEKLGSVLREYSKNGLKY